MPEQGRFKHYIDNINSYAYDDAGAFNQSLRTGSPRRVLMTPRAAWSGNEHMLGFVDSQGGAHVFHHRMSDIPVRTAIPELTRQRLVHGTLEVNTEDSRRADIDVNNAQVYLQFAPEYPYPGDREQVAAAEEENYTAWLEASREALAGYNHADGEPLFQLYRNHKTLAIDLTTGIYHHTTVVGLFVPRPLKAVAAEFPDVKVQDNTRIVNWGRVAAIDIDNTP